MITESIFGFIVVVSIILMSIVWHYFVKRFWTAVISSVITAVFVIQILSYLELGYLDSFFIITILTSGIYAFVVSSIIGLLFERNRKKHKKSEI